LFSNVDFEAYVGIMDLMPFFYMYTKPTKNRLPHLSGRSVQFICNISDS